MIKVGVVGGTGYTGVELLRVLVAHPQVSLQAITSRSEAGRPVADLFPSLRGFCDLVFVEPEVTALADCDVVFFATPHGIAQELVPKLWRGDVRIVDLSADFRLRDAGEWERWYGQAHQCPELLEQAVYGLPEKYRSTMAGARLVACAGCYPTAVQLGFWPLLENGLVDSDGLIANVASGVSGAGRQAKLPLLFAEMGESYKAYSAPGHRHQPEIVQGLSGAAERAVKLTFVPHLVPMTRGIHATLYARLNAGDCDLQALYERHYESEACVDVLPAGSHPETRSVKGANICRLAVHRPGGGDMVVVLSVIDNLAKGAATQAVQNMNIMCSLPELTGLSLVPLVP